MSRKRQEQCTLAHWHIVSCNPRLESMHWLSILPNTVTMNAAISSCEKCSKWQEALHLFNSILAGSLSCNLFLIKRKVWHLAFNLRSCKGNYREYASLWFWVWVGERREIWWLLMVLVTRIPLSRHSQRVQMQGWRICCWNEAKFHSTLAFWPALELVNGRWLLQSLMNCKSLR